MVNKKEIEALYWWLGFMLFFGIIFLLLFTFIFNQMDNKINVLEKENKDLTRNIRIIYEISSLRHIGNKFDKPIIFIEGKFNLSPEMNCTCLVREGRQQVYPCKINSCGDYLIISKDAFDSPVNAKENQNG